MKFITEEHIRKVRMRVVREGGIQPQFISLPDDYKDRVETTNVQSKKILQKIMEGVPVKN